VLQHSSTRLKGGDERRARCQADSGTIRGDSREAEESLPESQPDWHFRLVMHEFSHPLQQWVW
jgi:hypothetical protein